MRLISVSLSAVIPMAGAVVSVSPGAVVTVAGAIVNNISGAVTNIKFTYFWSIEEEKKINNYQIILTILPDISKYD